MLFAETRETLNDPELIRIRENNFQRLKELFDGKSSDKAFILNGVLGIGKTNPYENPEKWVEEVLDNLAGQCDVIRNTYVFRPLCIEYGPYGVHFIDKILGAEVFFQDGQWYNHYLKTPIGELQEPDLERDETWNLARRAAEAFLKQEVRLPLFGLPTIASVLNIAVNLYGEEILVAMYTDPDKVRHDFTVINNLLCKLHRWYLKNIPLEQLQPVVSWERTQPHGFGQICGCTNQLVSPGMYKEFIAPLDDELLSVYPEGGMIHLCGSHTHHIPVWRDMKSLRAIQLNDRAAEDLEVYFKGLREDQIIYLNPCKGMPVEKAMEITGGHRIVIVSKIEKELKTHNGKCGCCSH